MNSLPAKGGAVFHAIQFAAMALQANCRNKTPFLAPSAQRSRRPEKPHALAHAGRRRIGQHPAWRSSTERDKHSRQIRVPSPFHAAPFVISGCETDNKKALDQDSENMTPVWVSFYCSATPCAQGEAVLADAVSPPEEQAAGMRFRPAVNRSDLSSAPEQPKC